MLTLFTLTYAGQPFPRQEQQYDSPDQMMAEQGFTFQETCDLMNGKTIRDRFYIEFTPAWYDQLASEIKRNRHMADAKTFEEVAEIMGIAKATAKVLFSRFRKKAKAEGRFVDFLLSVRELRKIRTRMAMYE